MQFIEMTGKVLQRLVSDDELHPDELAELGINDESVVRINRQGDIELRRTSGCPTSSRAALQSRS